MPRKHSKVQYSKPTIPVHPSLTSSSSSALPHHGSHTQSTAPSTSVNDLIQHLRRSQAPSSPERPLSDAGPHPTVHPSLNAILQVPNTPAPRPRLQHDTRRQRGLAGPPSPPPPPRSWLEDSIHNPDRQTKISDTDMNTSENMRRLDRLPGIRLPSQHTLVHQTIKGLAKNWSWHLQYDQYYLATLPQHIKEALLIYIAVNSSIGLSRSGLELLFLDDTELDNATGGQAISHLDLSGAAIKDVSKCLEKQCSRPTSRTLSTLIPDTWDAPEPDIPQSLTTARFPCLTHLSLAHILSPSWRALLAALPHLHPLTHLSLAYWPAPSLTPNAQTATTSSPIGSIQYGGSGFYSASDGDWSEAAGILRRLSRSTLCLRWLDLEGCASWVSALAWKDTLGGGGVEWAGAWRSVETVRCVQTRRPLLPAEVKKALAVTFCRRARADANRVVRSQGETWEGSHEWNAELERMVYREKVYAKDFLDREAAVRMVERMVIVDRGAMHLKAPVFVKTDLGMAERKVGW
ncbi:hypothetical protein MMC13_001667 [Lambiella insularis]|nr:hypothetical protein [Lambiella insularis]